LIKQNYYFNTFRYKFLIVIYNIELNGIYKGEKTKREKEEERPRHPVLMYKCVCLTVGVCYYVLPIADYMYTFYTSLCMP